MHTEPQYRFISRDSKNAEYHEDTYLISYPDGAKSRITRQIPKRVGKTQRDK